MIDPASPVGRALGAAGHGPAIDTYAKLSRDERYDLAARIIQVRERLAYSVVRAVFRPTTTEVGHEHLCVSVFHARPLSQPLDGVPDLDTLRALRQLCTPATPARFYGEDLAGRAGLGYSVTISADGLSAHACLRAEAHRRALLDIVRIRTELEA